MPWSQPVSPLLEEVWQTLRPRVTEFKTSEVQQHLLQQHHYGPLALLEDLEAHPARGEADVIASRMLPHVSSRPVRGSPPSSLFPLCALHGFLQLVLSGHLLLSRPSCSSVVFLLANG